MLTRRHLSFACFVTVATIGYRPLVADEVPALIEEFAEGHNGRSRQAYVKVVEIGKPAIPHLSKALEDRRKNVRWLSVEALGAIGGEEVLSPLLIALQDKDKDVRRYAASFLGRWGHSNENVISALRKALYDPNPEVVWHAMGSLDRLGDASYKRANQLVDSLCAHLEDPNEDQRLNAATALGMIGSSRACGPLVKALAYPGSSGSYRNTIVDALGKIGSGDAVQPLLELFTNRANKKGIRVSAAFGLQTLADPMINDRVLPFTKSPELWVRCSAARALGFKGNAAAARRLMAIVEDEEEEGRVRESAVVSLGKIGDARAVDVIAQALLQDDASLAREAAQALGKIGSQKAAPALTKALSDSRLYVVMHSARSLGVIGDKRAARPIFQLFDREDALKNSTSSSYLFANIATVAHHALAAIVKEDLGLHKHFYIPTDEKLKEVREMWRIKLGLQNEE